MIGVIERIKNSVLLKCSTLNDNLISKDLSALIDKCIYHFAESLSNMISNDSYANESDIRNNTTEIIKNQITKKIKRKLFIDSLALQITNDSFIEDYVNDKIDIIRIKKIYLKELNKNKNSNQLNMTEDLNLTEILQKLNLYVEQKVIIKVKENIFIVNSIHALLQKLKDELENSLEKMIQDADLKYLNILIKELQSEIPKEEEESDTMLENVNEEVIEQSSNKFEKYDDMTLYNKMILCLNTKEENLSRIEKKIEKRKDEVDELLSKTNKNIEANIERENDLSQRKLELNAKEIELNSKLSEAEVIFLNIKPLIKGLNKIKEDKSSVSGGNDNE